MIVEAIQWLHDQSQKAVGPVEVDGRKYWPHGALVSAPTPEAVRTSTLAGLAAYLVSQAEPINHVVLVDTPRRVVVLSPPDPITRKRHKLAVCEPEESRRDYFGSWIDAEEFTIWLLSSFSLRQDSDVATVLKITGTLVTESVHTATDDGVTQVVATKRGVGGAVSTPVKNPYTLAPFRTWHEVEPALSQFVLRMKQREGKAPAVALFTVNDGGWQAQTTAAVREKLEELLGEAWLIVA